MSRIQAAFQGRKAFIAFITCGDPDLETTKAAVKAAAANGADLIELGIPFSDPTAEGPVIQAANMRALQNGITTDQIFAFVHDLRKEVNVPLVFMTYANVVFSYGTARFCARCADCGIDGIILPDVPFEEKGEFEPYCRAQNIDLISMIAPTSGARIRTFLEPSALVSLIRRRPPRWPGSQMGRSSVQRSSGCWRSMENRRRRPSAHLSAR